MDGGQGDRCGAPYRKQLEGDDTMYSIVTDLVCPVFEVFDVSLSVYIVFVILSS